MNHDLFAQPFTLKPVTCTSGRPPEFDWLKGCACPACTVSRIGSNRKRQTGYHLWTEPKCYHNSISKKTPHGTACLDLALAGLCMPRNNWHEPFGKRLPF